ncbi:hypothetical protein Golob_010290 [Gossypium lobatum]|uniref:Uncharacterized protein n=1 Tax=Gossypium lobatum TaxID=34289 RepID=A0A7J8MLA9_9ROSI|nr:hypothetical protein [Gossypium lobatum]
MCVLLQFSRTWQQLSLVHLQPVLTLTLCLNSNNLQISLVLIA